MARVGVSCVKLVTSLRVAAAVAGTATARESAHMGDPSATLVLICGALG